MTATWYELSDSPREDYSRGGFRATRKILTAWADRTSVAKELMGVDVLGVGNVNSLQYPDNTSVRCVRVMVAPLTDDVTEQALSSLDTDLNTYESYAVLTANYETIEPIDPDLPEAEEGTYMSYRLSISSEALIIPGVGLKWASDAEGKAPQEADLTFTFSIPIQEHHLTWHRVLNPPKTTFRDLIGHVNDAVYLGAATGTLLFTGATLDREWAFEGEFDDVRPAYRVNLTFKERRIKDGAAVVGWNYAWRSLPEGSRGWQEMENGNGEPIYASGDFTRLTQGIDPGA
jgi:hypothetical protein